MTSIRIVRQILAVQVLAFLLVFIVFPFPSIGADSDFEIPPYVQNVNNTSARIFWKSVGREIGGRVDYSLTTAYGVSAVGRTEYVVMNGRSQPKKGSIVRAQLTDLLPGLVYHYRVALSASVSDDRTFRTVPEDTNAAFTFLVYGDSRSNPQMHARVVSAALDVCQPEFVLFLGDAVVSSSNRQSVWVEQFFGPVAPLLKKSWLLFTRGNHERSSWLLSLYSGPPGGKQGSDYYSFDWGPVHVVTIDTNKPYLPGSEQYQFLKRDLAASSRPFKVFFGHHPAYSSGRDGSTKEMQKYLQPLFEEAGVRLVLAGHHHDYERTIVKGITYVVSGGGGAPLHGQEHLDKNPNSLVFRKSHHFVKVDVVPGAMVLTAWVVDNDAVSTIVDRAVITP